MMVTHRNPIGSVEEGYLVLLCFGCGHFNHRKLGKNKESEQQPMKPS